MGEVHSVVTNDDAVLELCVTVHATLRRMSTKRQCHHVVPCVLPLRLMMRYFELAGSFRPCVGALQEGHSRRAHRYRDRNSIEVKIVFIPEKFAIC
jgi:hypothetical protein